MRKIIKNKNLVPVTIADLNLDDTPDLNSTDPVTSRGVATAITEAVGGASDALQEQIDDIAEKAGSGYTPKGPASVASLNGLTGQENGWLYTMTDAGTLTEGSLAVVAGDTVAWDEANSVWYKAMDYAPRQYGTNKIKNLPTSITAFRTDDVIPVDGPSGTAKMSKDDLLRETAENAVNSGVAASTEKVGNIIITEEEVDSKTIATPSTIWTADTIQVSKGDSFRIVVTGSSAVPSSVTNYVLLDYIDENNNLYKTLGAVFVSEPSPTPSYPYIVRATFNESIEYKCDADINGYIRLRTRLISGSVSFTVYAVTGKTLQAQVNQLKPRVSSTIYIAASDSLNSDKEASDIVCDGLNDAQTIKNAIDAVATMGGGKIVFKKGRYYIDHVGNRNACIGVNQGKSVITLESEIPNTCGVLNGQDEVTGAQFYMTGDFYDTLDENEQYFVFKFTSQNWAELRIKDIGVILPTNQKKIVALDLSEFKGFVHVSGFTANAYNADLNVTANNPPPVPVEGCIGIRTICGTGTGPQGNSYDFCTIKGFYECFAVCGEHVLMRSCAAVFSVYGYTFGHYLFGDPPYQVIGRHPNVLIKCIDERGVNFPKFYKNTRGQSVILIGFSLERSDWATPGGVLGDLATEDEANSCSGEITYTLSNGADGDANSVACGFWKDGYGKKFRSTNLAQATICDTATRLSYAPNFMQRIYDTDLDKEVICIDPQAKTWVDTMGNNVDA